MLEADLGCYQREDAGPPVRWGCPHYRSTISIIVLMKIPKEISKISGEFITINGLM